MSGRAHIELVRVVQLVLQELELELSRGGLTADPVAETRCHDPTHAPAPRQIKGERGVDRGSRKIKTAFDARQLSAGARLRAAA